MNKNKNKYSYAVLKEKKNMLIILSPDPDAILSEVEMEDLAARMQLKKTRYDIGYVFRRGSLSL